MYWQDYIESNPKVLGGKPIIKGTRLSVEFIIERLADGWTKEEIFENYSNLNEESLKAVYNYIYECLQDGLLFTNLKKAA